MAKKKQDFRVGVVLKGKDKASGPVGTGFRKIGRQARIAVKPIRAVGRALTSLKTIGAAVVTGVAVRGIARQVQGYAEMADELAKFSRQMGVSVEALQEWRHASEIAGVGTDVVNKAFAQLTKRVGEAKAGTGELTTFLGKASPALLEQVKGATNMDEAMQLVVRAMEQVEDKTKRAALAAAFFGGRTGLQMVRFADAGSEAIGRYRKEISDFGTVSEEEAKRAEDWMDEMARLKGSIQGVKNAIGAELLPVLQPLITKTTKWITANRELIGQGVGNFIQDISDGLPTFTRRVGIVVDAVKLVGTTIGGAIDLLETFGKMVGEGIPVLLETLGIIDDPDEARDRAAATGRAFKRPGEKQRVAVRAEYLGQGLTETQIGGISARYPERFKGLVMSPKERRRVAGGILAESEERGRQRDIAAQRARGTVTEEQAREAYGLGAQQSSALKSLFERVRPMSGAVEVHVTVDGTAGAKVKKLTSTGATKTDLTMGHNTVGATQ